MSPMVSTAETMNTRQKDRMVPIWNLGGIGEQLGYGHHAQFPDGLVHAGKVHHAEAHGHHIAHDHAQQDIQLLGHALEGWYGKSAPPPG